jgi:hypothetical protein
MWSHTRLLLSFSGGYLCDTIYPNLSHDAVGVQTLVVCQSEKYVRPLRTYMHIYIFRMDAHMDGATCDDVAH